MNKGTLHMTTFVILTSILTIVAQFTLYFFLGGKLLTIGIAALINIISLFLLLEKFLTFETCFNYSLLNVFVCFIINLLSYYGGEKVFLPFEPFLLLFIAINWFIPFLFSILRYLFNKGARLTNFHMFFRNQSIIFCIIYIGIIVYLLFFKNDTFVLYYEDLHSINFIPFLTFATLIEDYLDKFISLNTIVTYLMQEILLFLPYGFYCILLLHNFSRFIRFLALLFLPIIIEIIQKTLFLGKADIDDVIFGLIGGFLGGISYHILNRIFRSVTDEDFLSERNHYTFSNKSLRF